MSEKIPAISFIDNVKFNLFHMIPFIQKGIFTRNKKRYSFLTHYQSDPLSVRFIETLQKKYQSDYLYLWMLNKKSLLVLDEEGIRHILEHSPDKYAETDGKRKGMSHFQPDALTISRGEKWQDRHQFNKSVLQDDGGLHAFAENFLDIIRDELALFSGKDRSLETWDDFERLFARITVQIIFGKGVNDTDVTDDLKKMMLESNNVIASGSQSEYFDRFYNQITSHLNAPPKHCLAARCKSVHHTAATKVENQIPHWIFAMGDTLAINTVGTLVLISAHTDTEQQIRKDLQRIAPDSAKNIHRMKTLEGCIQEAMRLWPSTLILMREAIVNDQIGDRLIPTGTQIMIHNGFNHRDETRHAFANRFTPEIWMDRKSDFHFNHLSNGPQACAGKDLALFISKAVLALLLSHYRFHLEQPRIEVGQPIPHGFDHFNIKFEKMPRE